MDFENLWQDLSKLSEVEAIALGGSRGSGKADAHSDYDLYVYCTSLPPEGQRMDILKKYCSKIEAGNDFWELEDDCVLNDGTDIDILYRSIDDFSQNLFRTLEKHEAGNGYTTCLWHNLLHSKILYDPHGRFEALQDRWRIPYPETLREKIITRNRRLLEGNLPSYDRQIQKASSRSDLISVNHRTAAWIESYFDLIFALNRMTHPGEKRMMQIALEQADLLPEHFEENLNALFENLYSNPQKAQAVLADMIHELDLILQNDQKKPE